jgi:hypothetical protein
MSLIRIEHNPSRGQLILFGFLWLAALSAIGCTLLARPGLHLVAILIFVAAAVVPAIGWPLPRFMRWVYLGTVYLTLPIGYVVSHLLLAIAYYLVLTPTGLLMRVFGYDPMHRRFDRDAESYWVPRERDEDAKSYFRQF